MTATTSKGEKARAEKAPAARAVTRAPSPFAQANVLQPAGNLAVQSLMGAGARPSKYDVSTPGDPLEREAERVADRVVRGGAREGGETPRSRGGVGAYGR